MVGWIAKPKQITSKQLAEEVAILNLSLESNIFSIICMHVFCDSVSDNVSACSFVISFSKVSFFVEW